MQHRRHIEMHEAVLQFWFNETEPSQWFGNDPRFDAMIAERFGAVHRSACRCELYAWRNTAEGRLAEVILLDQFSRNIHRGAPESFASDPLALALAQEAVSGGEDATLTTTQRDFLYMPFMHSESLLIHDVAHVLFAGNGAAKTIEFERKHRRIIERFGRYPHRNDVLGRQSTPAEIEFLREPGSGF